MRTSTREPRARGWGTKAHPNSVVNTVASSARRHSAISRACGAFPLSVEGAAGPYSETVSEIAGRPPGQLTPPLTPRALCKREKAPEGAFKSPVLLLKGGAEERTRIFTPLRAPAHQGGAPALRQRGAAP